MTETFLLHLIQLTFTSVPYPQVMFNVMQIQVLRPSLKFAPRFGGPISAQVANLHPIVLHNRSAIENRARRATRQIHSQPTN